MGDVLQTSYKNRKATETEKGKSGSASAVDLHALAVTNGGQGGSKQNGKKCFGGGGSGGTKAGHDNRAQRDGRPWNGGQDAVPGARERVVKVEILGGRVGIAGTSVAMLVDGISPIPRHHRGCRSFPGECRVCGQIGHKVIHCLRRRPQANFYGSTDSAAAVHGATSAAVHGVAAADAAAATAVHGVAAADAAVAAAVHGVAATAASIHCTTAANPPTTNAAARGSGRR